MREKIMSLYLSPFFFSKRKRKYTRVRDEFNLCKTNKAMRKEIKNILINIWFNYFFGYYFRLRMLS